MEKNNLYNIAEQQGISVSFFPLKESRGLVLEDDGKFYIALHDGCSENDEKIILAHELGHCFSGGAYSLEDGSLIRVKLEKKAESWAIERLVPLFELKRAIKQGDEAISALADRFGVTEDFMQKVYKHYLEKVSA
ncbi:MAG: ImmA/IrrE family metallo-endopeptidase [Clostridia bacterium]|nr:ImmA/IrrE family metallo-endopeptidase [Clostridia bacterium]